MDELIMISPAAIGMMGIGRNHPQIARHSIDFMKKSSIFRLVNDYISAFQPGESNSRELQPEVFFSHLVDRE